MLESIRRTKRLSKRENPSTKARPYDGVVPTDGPDIKIYAKSADASPLKGGDSKETTHLSPHTNTRKERGLYVISTAHRPQY